MACARPPAISLLLFEHDAARRQVAALREPTNSYILCSRNLDAGKEAIQKLKDAGVTAKIDLLQLEVTSDDQIAAAVKFVEDTYGRLDGEHPVVRG